ncbi:MAG TPA: carboxypeptidase-like regulatory domain-containing protein [Terracidiphilus sp.]|nr:carboxypeptidase-like regulatory domain-containing protein [Terracidiphilus sp.]
MRGLFPGLKQERLLQPCLILFFACLLAMPAGSFAQSYFGTVTGVLTDATGAVVPGARLTLTDQDKGYAFNATSDGSGRYLFRSIPPGVYSVTADMPGFAKTVRTGVRVDVNQNATADLSLKVAGSSQTVAVNAQSQALDAEDATTGLVVDRSGRLVRTFLSNVLIRIGAPKPEDFCEWGRWIPWKPSTSRTSWLFCRWRPLKSNPV